MCFARANRLSPNRKRDCSRGRQRITPNVTMRHLVIASVLRAHERPVHFWQTEKEKEREKERDRSGIRVSKIVANWTHSFFYRFDCNI